MRARRKRSIVVGVLCWVAVLAVTTWQLVEADARWLGQVGRFALRLPERALVRVPLPQLAVETPIFVQQPEGHWLLDGYVSEVERVDPSGTLARVVWNGEAPLREYELTLHRSRTDLAGMLEMMLPPEKRQRIEQLLAEAFQEHGEEIAEALRPLLERAARESLPAIEEGLRRAVGNHREELRRLADRYRQEIVEDRLVPLIREEVVPVVREHGGPVARDIGRELWDRASLWRFGWRALYDRSPLPDRELTRREWDRFVDQEAIPVIEEHLDELVEAQRRIVAELSRNEEVRRTLRTILGGMVEDPELQRLVGQIVREAILENEPLREVWAGAWQSDEARRAWHLTGDRLEPVVREIGDELFGTREEGIDPAFARLLRSQVLGKDRQWILAEPAEQPAERRTPIPVRLAERPGIFPVAVTGGEELADAN